MLPDGRTVYRVIRPVFEGALDDLKRGVAPNGQRLDGLIVYDIDRLTRDNRHLEDAIEVVQHFGRPILDITGTLDLLTDNGRTVARIVVATNNKQSADTARRVRRKHQALQQAGIPTGGRRPFGWNDDKRTLNPSEADAIRDGAERILRGAPVPAVVVHWNEAGLLTPWGNKWVKGPVKRVFRNPRLCGLRSREVHEIHPETGKETVRVEVVRDASGKPVKGLWEPILSVADWEAVTAVIGANPVPGRGDNARKYLLTGTLRCGREECGALLRAAVRGKGKYGDDLWYYVCPSSGLGGCGGISVPGRLTDEFIVEAVIDKLELEAQRRGAQEAPEAWPKEDELERVRQDINDLTAAWRARPQQISSARYFALLPELEREERMLASERERWMAKVRSGTSVPTRIREEWPGYTLAEKRSYIGDALIAVTIAPANGLKRWNPDRLDPLWRED
jgi:DNA invertase Pin-like site-specific DNA recombinase